MLAGNRVILRARRNTDLPILHAGLYDDVPTRLLVSGEPWRPVQLEHSPFHPSRDERTDVFTVTDASGDTPLGAASLWGVDNHNRLGHLGMSLLPQHRGHGYAGEVIQLLCRYGFQLRGLHRLQLETLADNTPMIKTAATAGFTREGLLRRSAWLAGQFVDEVIYGLLADEWQPG